MIPCAEWNQIWYQWNFEHNNNDKKLTCPIHPINKRSWGMLQETYIKGQRSTLRVGDLN